MRIHYGLPADPALALGTIQAATDADGIAPLSEQFLRGLSEQLGHAHLTAEEDGAVVGIAAFDGATAELVVHPDYRRRGIATALINALETAPIWAHGNLPAARALAAGRGWASIRELLVMETQLDNPTATPPAGMELLSLEQSIARFGEDAALDAWLQANNEAFSWHPEQGGWDRDRLAVAMRASWFNPADVLLLWNTTDNGPEIVGFHWTKDHGDGLGEIYVVGLAANYRGAGLGTPLIQLGLAHLARTGAERVILYVEANNTPAVAAYEKLGFATTEQHVLYAPEGENE